MGQRTYETSIQQAILDLDEPGWAFRSSSVGGGRSEATVRVPHRVLNHAGGAAVVGSVLALRHDLVHRFDLRSRAHDAPTCSRCTTCAAARTSSS